MQFAAHVLTLFSHNFISGGNADVMKAVIKVCGCAGVEEGGVA